MHDFWELTVIPVIVHHIDSFRKGLPVYYNIVAMNGEEKREKQ